MMNQKSPFDDLTLQQKIEKTQWLSLFPALTVMVFLRRRVGFRIVRPTWLICMAVILLVLSAFAHEVPGASDTDAFLVDGFALVMLGLGLFQRWERWRELNAGARWFTYSTGISWFESLPLPDYFFQHQRINRFLDPIACWIIGFVVWLFLSKGLGAWVMFAAAALCIFEQARYEKALDKDLDILDGMFANEVQAEVLDRFDPNTPEGAAMGKPPRTEETAGIPTGVAPDIQRQIVKRQKRVAPPDNLVSSTSGADAT